MSPLSPGAFRRRPPGRSVSALALLASLGILSGAANAAPHHTPHAKDLAGATDLTSAHEADADGQAPQISTTESTGVAGVSFSRAGDLSGQKPAYAAQVRFSGQAAVVTFSSRRPPVFSSQMTRSLSYGSLPSRLPVAATAMTSGFGMRLHPLLGGLRPHLGIDLAAPMGTPILATASGVVSAADWRGGYGLFVALDNGASLETRYGHLSRLNVVPGQQVQAGDVIGYVGSTGRSTGPHLHYEVRVNGRAVDPTSR